MASVPTCSWLSLEPLNTSRPFCFCSRAQHSDIFFQNQDSLSLEAPSLLFKQIPQAHYGTGKLIIPLPPLPNDTLYLSRKSPRAYPYTGLLYLTPPILPFLFQPWTQPRKV